MEISISKKVLYREVIDYIMIALGCISYGIGWTIFLLPNNISTGGVAGLSSTVFWALNIPVSYTYFVLNAILLTVALKTLGWRFCVKTILWCVGYDFCYRFLARIFSTPYNYARTAICCHAY